MSHIDFNTLTNEEVAHFVIHMTPEELQVYANELSPLHLSIAVAVLQPQYDPLWKEKFLIIASSVKEKPMLESIGKTLSLVQALELLEADQTKYLSVQENLPPIFVGLSAAMFIQILSAATPGQLNMLKLAAGTEPIQHHLSLFIRETHNALADFEQQYASLCEEIAALNIFTLTRADLSALKLKLNNFSLRAKDLLFILNKALAVSWNTLRTDLIDHLNKHKEQIQRYSHVLIGEPCSSDHAAATGLYNQLDAHLSAIYGDPLNPHDIEALQDDDPSIEALTKLSVWYPEDYIEIGLLPPHVQPEAIGSTQRNTEKDWFKNKKADSDWKPMQHEKLFVQALNNLKLLGLHTVADMKNAQIYSKNMLCEYIQEHLHVLS